MKRKIFATYTGWLVAVNVAVFFLAMLFMLFYGQIKVVEFLALQPSEILSGGHLWTFLTSMFMHGGITHLFVNMVSLMFIGSFVERLIGRKRFIWLYFGGGIFASALFVAWAYYSGSGIDTFAVGASGAIFALGGLLAVLTPRLPVLVFFIIPAPMWIAMIGLLGIMWIASLSLGLPIGNVAHLGGLILGVSYGFYLKLKYPHKTKMIARYFSR